MKNQYSFRLTTTLLPSDTSAKTTQVINKVDSDGNKFYPNFTEETVVITNDDRTIMETTRATCTNWVLTFVKRGLSDDSSATQIANRKLTWNPGSICFVTAWASDWIDRDDDMTWAWDQTYAGDAEYRWKATYKWRLITEKWVEYPHFDSLEELQAYSSPFGWMFAVVDSDWELYRYNAESETWSVVTTSTPVQPAKASTVAIGTVRGATDAEFAAWTATWSEWELLVATPAQIKTISPNNDIHITPLQIYSDGINSSWQTASIEYDVPRSWFVQIEWDEQVYNWRVVNHIYDNWSTCPNVKFWTELYDSSVLKFWNLSFIKTHKELIAVWEWKLKLTMAIYSNPDFTPSNISTVRLKIKWFFYYW